MSNTALSSEVNWKLDQLKAGDQGAWREAVRELSRLAAAEIKSRMFSTAAMDDLIQVTLKYVAIQINTFVDDRHIRCMTVVIARNQTSHYLRDETAGKRDRRRETNLEAATTVPAIESTAWWVQLDYETVLSDLDPLDRALLVGSHVEGLKSHELAARYGLSASAVRGRIMNTLAALRKKYSVAGSGGIVGLIVAMGVNLGYGALASPNLELAA